MICCYWISNPCFWLLQVYRVYVRHDGRRAHHPPQQAHNNSFHHHDTRAAVQQAEKWVPAILRGLCWRREGPHHITGVWQDEVSWYTDTQEYLLAFPRWKVLILFFSLFPGILRWRTGERRSLSMWQSKEMYWWWSIMQDPHWVDVCRPRYRHTLEIISCRIDTRKMMMNMDNKLM